SFHSDDVNTGIRTVVPVQFSVFRAQYYIMLGGKTVWVEPGVTTVTVKFQDGTTAKFLLVNPTGTVTWVYIAGSARDKNGNPINPQLTGVPTSEPPASPPNPNIPTFPNPVPQLCTIVNFGSVCVSVIGYGNEQYCSPISTYLVPC